MLSHTDIVPYLLRRRLISSASVVEGDLVVADMSRRNRNFKVISERGPSYLLKQAADPSEWATVAHENAVYEALHSVPDAAELRKYLTHRFPYDEHEHLVILEFVRDAKSIHEHYRRYGRLSRRLAGLQGAILSQLHQVSIPVDFKPDVSFSAAPPWILSLHHPGLDSYRTASGANLQLIQIIQHIHGFDAMLDNLRSSWHADTLIHRDVRWDNWLIVAHGKGQRGATLKLVDWEFAGVGDPLWDVGCALSDFLSFWLLSIPVTGEDPPDRFLDLARFPLARMQPAIRSFWSSYRQGRGLDDATSATSLVRSVEYAAARLLQTAFEHTHQSARLTGNDICMLQLSFNILQRPHEAIAHLLGIPLRDWAAA